MEEVANKYSRVAIFHFKSKLGSGREGLLLKQEIRSENWGRERLWLESGYSKADGLAVAFLMNVVSAFLDVEGGRNPKR